MNSQRSAARWRCTSRAVLLFSPVSRRAAGAVVPACVVLPALVGAGGSARRRMDDTEGTGAPGCVVDFVAAALQTLSPVVLVRAAQAAPAGATVVQVEARRPSFYGGRRMALHKQRLARTQPVELRVFHPLGTQVLSRTWSNAIQPQ